MEKATEQCFSLGRCGIILIFSYPCLSLTVMLNEYTERNRHDDYTARNAKSYCEGAVI